MNSIPENMAVLQAVLVMFVAGMMVMVFTGLVMYAFQGLVRGLRKPTEAVKGILGQCEPINSARAWPVVAGGVKFVLSLVVLAGFALVVIWVLGVSFLFAMELCDKSSIGTAMFLVFSWGLYHSDVLKDMDPVERAKTNRPRAD